MIGLFLLLTKFFVLLISRDFNNFHSTFEKKKLRFSLSKNDKEPISLAELARFAEVKFSSVLHEASQPARCKLGRSPVSRQYPQEWK